MYDLSKLARHGDAVYIAENVVIKRPHLVSVGSHIAIDDYFYCTTKLTLGSYIHISPSVTIIGGEKASLLMEDFSGMSAGCRIICASDEYLGKGLISPVIPDKYRDRVICEPVIMKSMSTLGTNVVVNPGTTIGQGAVVGANSYVNRDIPEWEIWVGSPVRFIRKREKETMLKYAKELLNES